jgi:GT2 family glycosyltransferase
LVDVFWGRSNGVLYALAPARQGILPWNAMWMAYEDLEYGWRLHDHGYRQVIVCDAVFHDTYEYQPTAFGYVINKPTWRTYYNMRNLILAIRHTRNRPLYHATGALRFVLEFWVIVLLRRNKWRRMRMLWAGAIDGIRGVEERSSFLDYSSA